MVDMLSTALRRKLLFTVLYFCEGAPIGFIWWSMPTHLRFLGFPVDTIALLTSSLTLPWALKFLWSPAVDIMQSARWNIRSWIIASQICMAAALIPVAAWDGETSSLVIIIFLFTHTIAAATQDVAIDTLCIASVPHAERGAMNGWMQAGMLLGRSLFGGGAIVLSSMIGFAETLTVMIVMMFAVSFSLMLVRIPSLSQHSGQFRTTLRAIRTIIGKRSLWFGIAFAVFGGFAYEGVGIVAGPFLVDTGLSSGEIGIFFSSLSVGAMIVGALAGGVLCDRFGSEQSTRMATVASVAAVCLVAVTGFALPDFGTRPVLVSMTVLYFSIGAYTAAAYTMFMNMTDNYLRATQFSAFMSATNLCELFAGIAAGTAIPAIGYTATFLLLSAVSLCSVPLIGKIGRS